MLTAAQKQSFADEGFVFFDPQLDPTLIDGVVQRIGNDMLGRSSDRVEGVDPRRPGSGRVQDAWKLDAGAKAIALAPAVLAALADLYGRKPRPFQTLNFRVGTEQKPHSDTVHFNSQPAGWMCGVWLALEDIDERNGAVVYYPGSHKLPEFNLAHVFADPALAARRAPPVHAPGSPGALLRRLKGLAPKYDLSKDYPLYEEFIQARIAEFGLRPALATMKKGQAFVWSSNLLHGGSPQQDPQRTRHSQVSHYLFEGTGYHQPMWNSDGAVREWKPNWIS